MMAWSLAQRIQRWITWNLLTRVMQVAVQGMENVPSSGPYILVWNHLHITDGMLLWSGVPAPTVFLATNKFQKKNRLVHAYLRGTGAILVRNGGVDRQAIKRALCALSQGTPVAIAPEGRVSPTGALCHAEPGVASLVCHSNARVIPVAIWGQYKAHKAWREFRRPRVTIRFGVPRRYPPAVPSASNLRNLTNRIMHVLATMLPPECRGVYGECQPPESTTCG